MNEDNQLLWAVEITINQERVFGLYADGTVLVKNEPTLLATARERLSAALSSLDEFAESSLAIGQQIS
jgi:exonuclease VII small subunit